MKKNKKTPLVGLICLVFLWTFFLLISKLETSDYFLGVNLKLQNLFLTFEYQKLVAFFSVITFLGSWQFIFPLTVLIALLLWKYRKFKYIFPLILSTAGAQLCNSILKAILQKPRGLYSLVLEPSFSFPSGHAAISIAFYGFLLFIFLMTLKRKRTKIVVSFLLFLMILLIGLSRIYLRVHFYSDVLGGFFLGGIWLTLGILLFKSIAKKTINALNIVIIATVILISSALFYLTLPRPDPIPLPKTIVADNIINVFNNGTLPKFTEKLGKKNQQPLSFLIVAKDDTELIKTFQKAGWFLAEKITLNTLLEEVVQVIKDEPNPNATVTPSIWNRTIQNFSFSKPTAKNTIRQRHHCRVWKTTVKTTKGKTLYVVTASYDPKMKTPFTHKIDADIDKEREYLFKDLLKTGKIQDYKKINFVGPTRGRNFQGDYFFTDGKAYLIYLP